MGDRLPKELDDSWTACVEMILGARMIGEAKDLKKYMARDLAAAALRAAGLNHIADALPDQF